MNMRHFKAFLQTAALALLALTLGLLATDAAAAPEPTEQELIESLRTGQPADKALACKKLTIYGTKLAVPELAKLLGDAQLASWSRIALEAIPDPAAEAALVDATNKVDGLLLVGVINSLGVRASAEAVTPLIARLKDADAGVAEAAAVALGKIGNEEAINALHSSLASAEPARRSPIAEGLILGAEKLLASGNAALAVKIYDDVRSADLPNQRLLEATRGAIVARGEDGIALLIEQLRSSDKWRVEMALGVARELPAKVVVDALSLELASAEPGRAALIAIALGDCATDGLPPAIMKAAAEGERPVRFAAIAVVGKLGDASSLPILLEIAAGDDPELSQAATNALVTLPGPKVNAAIVDRLGAAKGPMLPLLMTLIGKRQIEATTTLIQALAHEDQAVRSAALSALGATASANELGVLISALTSAKSDDERQAAEKALSEASIRMPDRENTAMQLAAAISQATAECQASLLRILGAVGGAKSLATIADIVKGGDSNLQDVGTRVLGEWMTADAAPALLEIAKHSATTKYHVRALRGYLRIARQLDMSQNDRLAMCRNALDLATRADERVLALEALKRCVSPEALELAGGLLDDNEVRNEAIETIVVIGERLKRSNPKAASQAGEKALQASPPEKLAQRARALITP